MADLELLNPIPKRRVVRRWNIADARAAWQGSQNNLAILQVGRGKWTPHLGLLCFYSRYFRAALRGPFNEALRGIRPLTASFDTVNTVVDWLYTGRLRTFDGYQLSITEFTDVFAFADLYDFPALRMAVIDNFPRYHAGGRLPDTDDINYALYRLPANSLLCRLLACIYALHTSPADCHANDRLELLSADFLAQVIRYKMKERSLNNGWTYRCDADRCNCCFRRAVKFVEEAPPNEPYDQLDIDTDPDDQSMRWPFDPHAVTAS